MHRPGPAGGRRLLAVLLLLLALVGCVPSTSEPEVGEPDVTRAPTRSTPTPARDLAVPQDVPRVTATPPPVAAGTATAPVRVTVAARGIDLPVDPVGVAEDGQMQIPPLAERGGWYRYGPDPGDEQGTTVVAAHVDSVASGGTGPFARLAEVAVGDVVEVMLADGSVRAYVVDAVTRVPKREARWPDVFRRDGPARLALVTCGGTFDRDTQRYRDNVLVTATRSGG